MRGLFFLFFRRFFLLLVFVRLFFIVVIFGWSCFHSFFLTAHVFRVLVLHLDLLLTSYIFFLRFILFRCVDSSQIIVLLLFIFSSSHFCFSFVRSFIRLVVRSFFFFLFFYLYIQSLNRKITCRMIFKIRKSVFIIECNA